MSDKYIFENHKSKDEIFSAFHQALEHAFPSINVTRIGYLMIYDKELPIKKSWRNLWGFIKTRTEKQIFRYRAEIQFEAEEKNDTISDLFNN